MNAAMLHRINSIESEMDAEHDLLAQCAASGQMSEAQRYQHERAGELDLRPLATEPIYMDSAYRNAGYEAGRVWPNQTATAKPKLRDRIDPQAVAIIAACIATWLGVYLASIWPFH